MQKYIVTGIGLERKLKAIGIEQLGYGVWTAYLISNRRVVSSTDVPNNALKWQADGAIWIGEHLDRLPEELHYNCLEDLMLNAKKIKWGDLSEQEHKDFKAEYNKHHSKYRILLHSNSAELIHWLYAPIFDSDKGVYQAFSPTDV